MQALAQALQWAVDGRRQAQFKKAQAGRAKQGEEDCKGYQHPGRLQACLQVEFGAEQAHQCAKDGKAQGHRQHVGQRQHQAAHAARLAAQYHAGEDRQHRQYAGGEGQCQAAEEEQRQVRPAPRLGCIGCRIASTCAAANRQYFGLWGVAQAFVGAALVADAEGEGAIVRVVDRHLDIQHLVIHLDIAEVLIMLGLPGRQHGLTQVYSGRLAAKAEAVLIEVVTLSSDKAQLHRLTGTADQTQLERLAHRQEIGAVVQWRTQLCGHGRLVEQAGTGRQDDEKQKQTEKTVHGRLAKRESPHHSGGV